MANGEGLFFRETAEFTVKGPIPLFCEEEKRNVSGCGVLDLHLVKPSRIGEIVFRNYYTATINILIQRTAENDPSNRKNLPWEMWIPKKVLMPSPHLEEGCNELFSLSATESLTELDRVVLVRFILRQPSPIWNVFRLEEINIFTELPRLGAIAAEFHEAQRLLELMRKQTVLALTTLPQYDDLLMDPTLSAAAKQQLQQVAPPIDNSQAIPYEIQKLPIT
ncbi:nicolin-1-like [Cimex lectularius]|uniref:Nicolin-1 n=1 Tax=Cimex lectularius TaxID=79782 RepID=A0A8I6TIJ9_CIMLE|nr:nicolin-1-like [Cimex lectularius]